MGYPLAALAIVAAGCHASGEPTTSLEFVAEPHGESYLCFGFDLGELAGSDIGAIELHAGAGPIALHHVSIYASAVHVPDGQTECLSMPEDAVPLHVWAAGGDGVALPEDMGLVIPAGTKRLVIQTHALRLDDGPAQRNQVIISRRKDAARRAAWLPLRSPTPAIRPRRTEESITRCKVNAELNVFSTWPHMHRVGASFHGSVVRNDVAETFITVDPWQFEAQHAYAMNLTLQTGDAIETRCVWRNDSDETVLPGPSVNDEMCGQSIVAWPVEAARCE